MTRIGIPQAHSNVEYAQRVAPSYAHAVELAGGTAVQIPLALTNPEIMRLAMTCDAILLPGSRADVNPEKYGAVRQPETHDADPARDNVDELLLQDAYNMHKPILAICFGMQITNVWRTGTLLQHVDTGVCHAGNSTLRHSVIVESESLLARITGVANSGSPELTVNTSHHQAVGIPGDGLRTVARSKEDRIIEAVEGTSPDHFVLGVQWHPERLVEDEVESVRQPSLALFQALVEAARQWHRQPRTSTLDFESLTR
ncbi:MAG TPA: gamma-glutamyl-gamma-aminobutyrate hydrolase family protein [Terriglobales bacterium]|jgi:putative glutamine amidotransferase|nr:gamma-glutamyl-gamma-aminobutyrate hydrolase family protein [Terriglobales bacterium]